MTAIRTRHLTKTYRVSVKKPGLSGAIRSLFSREHKDVHAVRDVSFEVARGELVGFLGPNGAGKTTTLKMLSGLLYPSSGECEVLGFTPWKRETEFQKRFSMVMGQRTQLWWDLPARETFALNQRIYEIPDAEFRRRSAEIIELLDLRDLVDVPVKKLSLGERMKAELACAILHEPQALLLDEPTLGLDLVMQKKLRQFILEYNRRTQATILLTSHNMADVEELCKRVLIIDDGRLLYDGDLSQIVQRYAPDKSVSLTSSRPLTSEELAPYGRAVITGGTSARIEIPRAKISAAISRLLTQVPVVDLAIEELPIEEIIRRVFLKTSALQTFHEGGEVPREPESAERQTDLDENPVITSTPRPLQP